MMDNAMNKAITSMIKAMADIVYDECTRCDNDAVRKRRLSKAHTHLLDAVCLLDMACRMEIETGKEEET